jgi:hypothetical protein
MEENIMSPKFELGHTYITPQASETLVPADACAALRRHASADWGDVCEEDRRENDLSLKEGFRLLSAYHDTNGTKFWIITEADRSATTILLPEEY